MRPVQRSPEAPVAFAHRAEPVTQRHLRSHINGGWLGCLVAWMMVRMVTLPPRGSVPCRGGCRLALARPGAGRGRGRRCWCCAPWYAQMLADGVDVGPCGWLAPVVGLRRPGRLADADVDVMLTVLTNVESKPLVVAHVSGVSSRRRVGLLADGVMADGPCCPRPGGRRRVCPQQRGCLWWCSRRGGGAAAVLRYPAWRSWWRGPLGWRACQRVAPGCAAWHTPPWSRRRLCEHSPEGRASFVARANCSLRLPHTRSRCKVCVGAFLAVARVAAGVWPSSLLKAAWV